MANSPPVWNLAGDPRFEARLNRLADLRHSEVLGVVLSPEECAERDELAALYGRLLDAPSTEWYLKLKRFVAILARSEAGDQKEIIDDLTAYITRYEEIILNDRL